MIKTVSLKCPECDASLYVEENRKQCFCQYCGIKIMIDDGSTTHIYRKVDEARIKEAEVKELIRIKELENEDKKRISEEKTKTIKIKASIILAIVGVIFILIGFVGGEATGNSDSSIYMLSMIGMLALLGIGFIWLGGSDKDNK